MTVSAAPRPHVDLQNAVVRFAGDSGDGMQLTGTEFTREAALYGNDLATFPDYPAEIRAPKAGYNYGETIEALDAPYSIQPARLKPGKYRNVTGNSALALGLIAAAQKAGLRMFYGSYPITPASDILHELSKYRRFQLTTFQAEDEIAAISAAIGASFAGALGVTGSSGPGIALKTEAMGLALMTELPLVIINVQRGGPSTGLPTN